MTLTADSRRGKTGMGAFADAFMNALRDGRLDEVRAMFVPCGHFVSGPLGFDGTIEDALLVVAAAQATVGPHEHVEVERVCGRDYFVDAHTSRWVDPDGQAVQLRVSVLVRVEVSAEPTAPYRVTSFEEHEIGSSAAADLNAEVDHIRRVVQRHVDSEFTNDVDMIMPTISAWDIYFPQFVETPDGFDVTIANDVSSARAFYELTRTIFRAVESTNQIAIYSPWYCLRVSVGTLESVAAGDGVRYQNLAATLFPVARDGIIGEITWARYPLADIFASRTVPDTQPRDERLARNAATFDEFFKAWTSGRAGQAAALISPNCCWVRRTVTPSTGDKAQVTLLDHASIKAELGASVPEGSSVEITNRIAESWYVFAEYRITPPRGDVTRVAALYPVADDGSLIGELSYAVVGPRVGLG